MKILLLNTSEKTGGAAIACNRLLHALRKNGVEAKMLVRDKQTDNPNVFQINTGVWKKCVNKFRFMWERLVIFLCNHHNRKDLFRVSIANTGNDISRHPLVREADIIHLHWVNQGFLSIRDIEKLILTGKPVVWTMHDMWPCTGICHHARTCINYRKLCGECFYLQSVKRRDAATRVFLKKKRIYTAANITFVGCSRWIADKAKTSGLTALNKVQNIPNPIDVEIYRPMDKSLCRKRFNLPADKKIILFGACKITDKRKGIDYLLETCNLLMSDGIFSKDELGIAIFGGSSADLESRLPYPVYNAGYLYQNEEMAALYNAVDLFLIPSLEDNLPNTIMEAMTCGTPCVGFNTGGIPEMIDHLNNGYVAEYQNPTDLANGIHWVLKEADYNELSLNARQKAVDFWREKIVAEQYAKLYESLMRK